MSRERYTGTFAWLVSAGLGRSGRRGYALRCPKPWRTMAQPVTARETRARRPCGLTMLNDHGVRRLAIAVLTQAVADLQGPIPEYRRSAATFMARRDDFDEFWCALVGLDGDAVRERLSEQSPHREEAA
jgi:hypothetical protein